MCVMMMYHNWIRWIKEATEKQENKIMFIFGQQSVNMQQYQPSAFLLLMWFSSFSFTHNWISAVKSDLNQNTNQSLVSTQFNNTLVIGFSPKTAQRSSSTNSLSSWMIGLLCRSGVGFTLPVNLQLVPQWRLQSCVRRHTGSSYFCLQGHIVC